MNVDLGLIFSKLYFYFTLSEMLNKHIITYGFRPSRNVNIMYNLLRNSDSFHIFFQQINQSWYFLGLAEYLVFPLWFLNIIFRYLSTKFSSLKTMIWKIDMNKYLITLCIFILVYIYIGIPSPFNNAPENVFDDVHSSSKFHLCSKFFWKKNPVIFQIKWNKCLKDGSRMERGKKIWDIIIFLTN